MIPIAFFPDQFQLILNKLPFVFLTAFPADLLMGKMTMGHWFEGMVVLTLWATLFFAIAFQIWKRGIRQYTGVGI